MEIHSWDEVREVLPPLGIPDRIALQKSIERDGVQQPILILPDGRIIDGHHRWKLSDGSAPYTIIDIPEDKAFDLAIELNIARRQLSRKQLKLVREKQRERHEEAKALALEMLKENTTQKEAADTVGIDQATVSRAKKSDITTMQQNNLHNSYIEYPDQRVSIPKSEHPSILERYEADETQSQIAADYQVTQPTISKIIKREKKKKEKEQESKKVPPAPKSPLLIVARAEEMTQVESESIDLIITSPPYNLGKASMPMGGEGFSSEGGGSTPREDGIGYDQYEDSLPEDEYQSWQVKCLIEMFRVAKDGASLFYNHKVRIKDGKAIHPMEWLRSDENLWTLRQEIVWDRGSTHNHSAVLFWPHDERIYWMTKGKPTLPERPIGMSTVWQFHGPVANTWHPAPFCEELPKLCLEAIGRDGIVVLDPFAGSCTTLKIALEYGYDAVGVDVSREYLDRAAEENGWTKANKN